MLSTTDPLGNVTKYVYDKLGRTIEEINADNTKRRTEYDATGRVIASYDELNGRTAYTYDKVGNLLSATDPLGNVTTYTYNRDNRPVTVTYPDGSTVTYTYNALGQTETVTDQLGGVTRYTYDALSRRKTVTDAESHVTEYFYSATGSVTKTTVDGHTVSEAEYDALGRTVKAIDGEGNSVTYTYDSVGNVKTYTDALGNVTRYEYNRNYQTVKVTDALGGSTTTSYDALGRVTQSTDAEGNATAYTYDANGNVLTVTDALGNTVKYTYDNRGRTATAKDKLGSVTTYTYDAKGNVTSTKDAAGYSTRYTYDALGNLTKTTNRMNESVSYTYDSMSRRIKEKNELNQTREYEYDEAGNLVSVTDGNRHVTTYTYDSLSRLVREENAEGGIAEYTYDYLGNISTYTVYGGNNERATTEYTYDAAGNLTKETSPLGYTTTYAYDANGNVTSRTDENGTETTYEYDALGRLIKREDRDGQVSYTYDKVGNVTSATSDAGTVSFAYDELYRTVKVTNEDGTETSYTYDANGNRLSVTYPDGKAVTTVYDELGQVLSLTDHDGTGILYTRDAEGRVTKESYTDGSTTEYTYNAAGLLTLQKEVTKDNETLRQIVYAYDDAGNLTSENRSGVGIDRSDELVRYYYDKADQLVKTNIEGVTTSYTYDKAGNLLSDGESTYTYDLQNRLITKTGADGTTTYTYDKAGNLTREIAPDGITNYTYNAQNKLVKGEKTNGESSTYVYNALGVRIANIQVRTNKNAGNQNADLRDGSHGTDYLRFLTDGRADWQRAWETEIGTTVQNDKETVTRHYVVDYLSIANRDIFVTEDGSYTTRYVYDVSGRRISAEFDYAPGTKRGEAGENLQSDIAVSIGKVFYRTSMLGSTLFAVDKNGEVIAHAIYDPWGNPLIETYTDANHSGLENLNNFTGYTYDLTLALYFAQNRFYDASTHRFTQEDTAQDGANWYVYCGNGPVLMVDLEGTMSKYLLNLINIGYQSGKITDNMLAPIVILANFAYASKAILDYYFIDILGRGDVLGGIIDIIYKDKETDLYEDDTVSNQAIYLSFHEIAQVVASKQIMLSSESQLISGQPKLEVRYGLRKEIDIGWGDYVWEVKPSYRYMSSWDSSLSKYIEPYNDYKHYTDYKDWLKVSGNKAGWRFKTKKIKLFTINGEEYYLGVESKGFGKVGYFFELKCDGQNQNNAIKAKDMVEKLQSLFKVAEAMKDFKNVGFLIAAFVGAVIGIPGIADDIGIGTGVVAEAEKLIEVINNTGIEGAEEAGAIIYDLIKQIAA